MSAADETASRRCWRLSFELAITTRSSAYARIDKGKPKCLVGARVASTLLRISSIVRLNKIALRGQPCFTPLRIGTDGVGPADVRTSVVAPV